LSAFLRSRSRSSELFPRKSPHRVVLAPFALTSPSPKSIPNPTTPAWLGMRRTVCTSTALNPATVVLDAVGITTFFRPLLVPPLPLTTLTTPPSARGSGNEYSFPLSVRTTAAPPCSGAEMSALRARLCFSLRWRR